MSNDTRHAGRGPLTTPAPSQPAGLAPGRWLHNPATGELAQLLEADADGRRIEVDLWLQPGAAVARAHVHDHLVERFEVREGEVGFQIEGRERTARAGDGIVEVPSGTVHDWWNAGDGVALVRSEVTAAASAPGRPAARFVAMIEAMWSLGALGRVNAAGVPHPLWLAAVAREYRDAIRFVTPPAPVQAVVIGPLAAIARRTGHDPHAPELHGTAAACAIPDPGADGLGRLLATPVGARSARGR